MGPEPRFEPESRDPQSRRMTTYPTLKCGSRDLNPGRPASTGPKPVPFGLSGTPAYKKKGYIETIKNLNKFFKMLRPGFEPESSARKAEMIGRTTPPEHKYK